MLYNEIMKEITSALTRTSTRSLPVAIVVSDGRPIMQRPVTAFTDETEETKETSGHGRDSALQVEGQGEDSPVFDKEKEEEKDENEEEEEEEKQIEEKVTEDEEAVDSDREEEKEEKVEETINTEEVNLDMNSMSIDTDSKRRLTTLQDVLSDAFAVSGIRDDNIRYKTDRDGRGDIIIAVRIMRCLYVRLFPH